MTLKRFSSRRSAESLSKDFLSKSLDNAISYDRIAGYFTSSIFEIVGENISKMDGTVRIICNSELCEQDVATARAADAAQRRVWCGSFPEEKIEKGADRFAQLFAFLRDGKVKVKVIPSEHFGLIHGKAGVITYLGGRKCCFIGSVNETKNAWSVNYEILWEDDSQESVDWVQEEFDALWNSRFAVNLSRFVMDDIERISKRTVVKSVEEWKAEPNAAAVVIEEPVYRESIGLAEHQKFFVNLAFNQHKSLGARLILADSVGLGKTIQLGMAAQLMALYGSKPVLVVVPKTLVEQWQQELMSLLNVPSAIWTGKTWIDEAGIEYPLSLDNIKRCPRKIGIISQGMITSGSDKSKENVNRLLQNEYECVVVDETHRARRRNLAADKENEKPDPNKLMGFLLDLSSHTKSMLLATATPVQLYPVEAWDLLNILAQGSDHVLGTQMSLWRRDPALAIRIAMESEYRSEDEIMTWNLLRNPFPDAEEDKEFAVLRKSLGLKASDACASGELFDQLRDRDRSRLKRLGRDLASRFNPFIRHIVRRTRQYLENTIDPQSGEPLIPKIDVILHGESEPIKLPPYLKDAYSAAEQFSALLGQRTSSAGFLRTMLLRRVGSSIEAGRITAEKMLKSGENLLLDIEDDEDECIDDDTKREVLNFTAAEIDLLELFVKHLSANRERDPKIDIVIEYLRDRSWLERGCIVFSQYFDSIWWLGEQLKKEFPHEEIGVYAGGGKSGIISGGQFSRAERKNIKERVKNRTLRLIIGTDAASEGLNLQTLGTLINLDLPWNPTRLEQRKGRIQRMGQVASSVEILNLRYQGSVEDRVHELLSSRLEGIFKMFGQIPDVLEDVWIDVALGEVEQAKRRIDDVPQKHPFDIKYSTVEKVDWESCSSVLSREKRMEWLRRAW